ncbi:MAG TPA: DUF4838 domain-containing protein [Sphingobacteriaceae bacterium]|nr:DUF4838 domain-containing protein [Sphingobacteriaceae bacterium]
MKFNTLYRFGVVLFALYATTYFNALAQKVEIVTGGKSDYVIFIDPAATKSVQEAAENLSGYISKQTGSKLTVVKSEKIPSGRYISLGANVALKASGLNFSGIKADGYKIITKGSNLFIFGEDTPDGKLNKLGGRCEGTANGVYSFLEKFAGIRWLMPGEMGEYIPATKNLVVVQTSLIDNPGLLLRNLPFLGPGSAPHDWEKRIRLGKVTAPEYNHAWEATIPASLYDKHPDYFAKIDGKHQPPAERHKLETTNPALVQAYADVIINKFKADPNRRWYSLSPSDGVNGEQGWSNSPETQAFQEIGPNGKLSKTPVVLKFYNDVAKIVRKEFPDRKLGGYIYSDYFYPPNKGIPALEPNLGFMIAASPAYGFQLYRKSTQKTWTDVIDAWGKAAVKSGSELYYYDLPTALMQHNGNIQPPAPDILNFIFHRLDTYNFLGTRFYGRPIWPVFGAMNYAIAKLCWNPKLDAHQIINEYYVKAYGEKSAPHISRLYSIIDSAYKVFYEKNPDKSWNLTPAHMKDIYLPIYPQIEEQMLRALKNKSADEKQNYRLQQFGAVFSVMEWNMRNQKLFPEGQKNKMALNDSDMDKLVLENENKELPAIDNEFVMKLGKFYDVAEAKVKSDKTSAQSFMAPNGDSQVLIYSPSGGNIEVDIRKFNGVAEFVRYNVYTMDGKMIDAGAMKEGKKITFPAEKGNYYYFDIVNRQAVIQFDIKNGIEAFKTNRNSGKGFRLSLSDLQTPELPVYFYNDKADVPFGIIMSFGLGLQAKVYSPDGKLAGELSTVNSQSSRYLSPANIDSRGFWKVVVQRPGDYKNKVVSFTLDEHILGWAQTGRNGLIEIKQH